MNHQIKEDGRCGKKENEQQVGFLTTCYEGVVCVCVFFSVFLGFSLFVPYPKLGGSVHVFNEHVFFKLGGWLKKQSSKHDEGLYLQKKTRWSCEIGKKQNDQTNAFQSPKSPKPWCFLSLSLSL